MGDPFFYPASPGDVPPDLTAVDRRYRVQLVLVVVYLGLFVLVYVALLGGAGYLLYRSVRFAWHARDEALLGGAAVAGSAAVVVFLGRPLFRRTRQDRSLLLEVRPENQPALFAFIRRLCEEIGAPLPRKVLLSPEVNAAVLGSSSLLNLVVPARQDLVIGLGLVNALNLMEFKAVLAHEFGHFAQKGLRLGPYVYASTRLIGEVVHGSDRVDYVLRRLTAVAEAMFEVASVDVRLALLVLPVVLLLYLLIALMKGFSAFLQWLHRLLSLSNFSLMRQMEINADLVSVSVAGSDAPIDVLVRLPVADNALALAAQDLATAADESLYTRDLFHHQHHAITFLRKLAGQPNLGEPPPLPEGPGPRGDLFRPEDAAVPRMWATHPSNHERELNVKRRYVRSPTDERPAWVLFADTPALRQKITSRFYQHLLERARVPALSEAETVQAFIDEEHAENTFDPRYQGAYDDRYLEPGDLAELVALTRSNPWSAERLIRASAELFSGPVRQVITDYHSRLRELGALDAVGGDEFEFRGQKYHQGEVRRLQIQVGRELTEHRQRLATLDRDVFLAHYQMASQLRPEAGQELLDRYRFQLELQLVLARVTEQRDWLQSVLYFLSSRKEISEDEYSSIVHGAEAGCKTRCADLAAAERLNLPELKNVRPGQPLSRFLLGELTVATFRLDPRRLKPKRLFGILLELARAVSTIRDRAHRLHFKSLAGILAFQVGIHARWSVEAGAGLDQQGPEEGTGAEQERDRSQTQPDAVGFSDRPCGADQPVMP
ncbi:MAG: M48 family metalloprotease [Gemmataceae bacterium]|nr:M48 family metalloprotease [Gemmataceae bacterium]